jgi:hypothetical protein
MSVESSLNLTPTLSLVRRGSRNLVSPRYFGGTKGVDLGCICKTEMLPPIDLKHQIFDENIEVSSWLSFY